MNKLFLLTASSSEAYQHYVDTIERGFSVDKIKDFLTPKQVEAVKYIYRDYPIKAWGATPGKGNKATWQKMEIGDPVLIYRKGNFEYYAFVTFKLHNPEIAKLLWKTNIVGETWEYIYFLDRLTEVSVPVKTFNKILEYEDNFNPYGFSSISSNKIKLLEKKFGSIDSFLSYLSSGKWIENETIYPKEIKTNIIQERVSRQIGKTPLLEANLENFLAERVNQLEPGLKLVARQLDTRVVGRLDLLCQDKDGNLVVVELKKGAAGPSIIDQTQRYMGWIMENKAITGQKVRGVIVVGTKDTALEYAVKANPLVTVKTFSINFA